MKRVLMILVLAMTLIFSGTLSVSAYSDVPAGSQLEKNVKALTDAGFICGYEDGTFRADRNITRAEFVKMMNMVMGLKTSYVSNTFSDVSQSAWYYEQVRIALQKGYIIGYEDGTFRPNNNITRQETAVIMDRLEKLSARTDGAKLPYVSNVSGWAADAVKRCVYVGLMTGDGSGNFRGTVPATRAEIAAACIAMLKYDGRITTDKNGYMVVDGGKNPSGGGGSGTGGDDPGTDPGDDPSVDPGTDPGDDPSVDPGTDPGNDPSVDPGADPGDGPGDDPVREPVPATGNIRACIESLCYDMNRLLKKDEYTSAEKQIMTIIRDSMAAYKADTGYDVNPEIKQTKAIYAEMTDDEKKTFKSKMQNAGLDVDAIYTLQDEFGFDLL